MVRLRPSAPGSPKALFSPSIVPRGGDPAPFFETASHSFSRSFLSFGYFFSGLAANIWSREAFIRCYLGPQAGRARFGTQIKKPDGFFFYFPLLPLGCWGDVLASGFLGTFPMTIPHLVVNLRHPPIFPPNTLEPPLESAVRLRISSVFFFLVKRALAESKNHTLGFLFL